MPTNVPTIQERFKAAIVHPTTQNTNSLVAVLADIHQAHLQELLEDVAPLVSPDKLEELLALKAEYAA